jgi:hypothetical protein
MMTDEQRAQARIQGMQNATQNLSINQALMHGIAVVAPVHLSPMIYQDYVALGGSRQAERARTQWDQDYDDAMAELDELAPGFKEEDR